MNYKHTQIGYLLLFILFFLTLFFGFILVQVEFHLAILFIMLFIILIVVSFATLTVTINGDYLRIKFGYGIFKKSFLIKEITSTRIVRNHWYYGWGIRLWLWPKMLIFNVSGFDAVEIKMKNNEIYRIGTDEPKKLERAILQAIK